MPRIKHVSPRATCFGARSWSNQTRTITVARNVTEATPPPPSPQHFSLAAVQIPKRIVHGILEKFGLQPPRCPRTPPDPDRGVLRRSRPWLPGTSSGSPGSRRP